MIGERVKKKGAGLIRRGWDALKITTSPIPSNPGNIIGF